MHDLYLSQINKRKHVRKNIHAVAFWRLYSALFNYFENRKI